MILAETAQVEGHLKKIVSVLESTPCAQAQTGWYADRSAGWINARFPAGGSPLGRLPAECYYSLCRFHLTDKKRTVEGVVEWVPELSNETTSIQYAINSSIPEPPSSMIFHQHNDDGSTTRLYAEPRPETMFSGFDGDSLSTPDLA